jgi:hypothetical protein
MGEDVVRNLMDKIGESVVWGAEQEVSLLGFYDWKGGMLGLRQEKK